MQGEDSIQKRNAAYTGSLEAKQKWMQRAKLFLHPSSYEGFGVVCLEVLYGGASVISFVKPMNQNIKDWHTVKTKEEMKEKAMKILQQTNTDHSPVLPFLISDCAKAFGRLFMPG